MGFHQSQGQAKSKCIGSEKAALEFKSIIEAKLKSGQPLPKEERPVPKLSAYYEKFSQNYLETALRHSARLRHQSNFNIHILPPWGIYGLTKSPREKMQEFIAALEPRKEPAKDSIRLALAAVRVMFNYAIEEQRSSRENPHPTRQAILPSSRE